MSQEQKQPRRASTQEHEESAADLTEVSARKDQLDDDVDAILDEIDSVLESNAEEFVKSFVQKGGQ
jgi:ubiquitin-like protein Pup